MEGNTLVLDFNINGQDLSCQKPSFDLVENSVGYLKARFCFSEDWDELYKIAIFRTINGTYAIHANKEDSQSGDGTFFIPYETILAPGFKVSCVGTNVKIAIENNTLKEPYIKTRITTEEITIPLRSSGPMTAQLGNIMSDELNGLEISMLALRVAKEAYTLAWDIEHGLQEVNSILGGGIFEYKDIRYRDDGAIELVDEKGYIHVLTYDMKDGKIIKTYLDGQELEAEYDGRHVIKIGNATVDISGIFE